MSVLIDNNTRLCECGEIAEYGCDQPGCNRLMCCECKPSLDDSDCPNEFCEEHVYEDDDR